MTRISMEFMMHPIRLVPAAVLLVCSALLSGCGDPPVTTTTERTTTTTATAPADVPPASATTTTTTHTETPAP